jgi:aquaporin Z
MSDTDAAEAADEFTEELDTDIWTEDPAGPSLISKMLAEAAGTFILVLIGVGTALTLGLVASGTIVIQGQTQGGILGSPTFVVGFAFAISVVIAAFAFGSTSGAHLNPAVTVGLWLAGRFPGRDVVPYVLAQVIGGLFAGLGLFGLIASHPQITSPRTYMASASIGFGDHSPAGFGLGAALIVEAVLTGLLVLVVLAATSAKTPPGVAPFAIGFSLAALVVLGIPFTNAALNPARATATAAFSDSWAFSQLWAFWVAPIVGAAIVGLLYRAFAPVEEIEIVETIEVIEA